MAEAKAAKKPPRRKKRPEGAPRSRGIAPDALGSGSPPRPSTRLAEAIEADGGSVLATLPRSARRQLADLRRPADRSGRAHPLPARPLRRPRRQALLRHRPPGPLPRSDDRGADRRDGHYWTPNGNHRLAAMRTLGARVGVAIVVPEPEVAHRILLLNTEKAHNLRERALEVARLAQGLAAGRRSPRAASSRPSSRRPALAHARLLLHGERPLRRRRLSSGAPADRQVPRRRAAQGAGGAARARRAGCWSWRRR